MNKQEVFLNIDGRRLKTLILGELSEAPCLVLLHGGLDCLATWKNFPLDLHRATGLTVIAYERFGHGESGRLEAVHQPDYRHIEAEHVVPAILEKLDLTKVILVGHSDGAAMALLAASVLKQDVLGVCAIAPPLVVNSVVRGGIEQAVKDYETGALAKKLSVFHGDATEALFYGWANAWLGEAFNHWTCKRELQNIICPVHVIFGQADDYGYHLSLTLLMDNLTTPVEAMVLKSVGHMPQHHARKETIDSISRLIQKVS